MAASQPQSDVQSSIIGPNYQAPWYRLLFEASGGLDSDEFAYTDGQTVSLVRGSLGIQWREFIQLSVSYEWGQGGNSGPLLPVFTYYSEDSQNHRVALEADVNLVRTERFRLQTGLQLMYREIVSNHSATVGLLGRFVPPYQTHSIEGAKEAYLGMAFAARLGMVIARSEARSELIAWLGCRLNGYAIIEEPVIPFLPDSPADARSPTSNSLSCRAGLQLAWGI